MHLNKLSLHFVIGIISFGSLISLSTYAASYPKEYPRETLYEISEPYEPNEVAEKIEYEREQDHNPFALSAYEPNYFLPFNYTFSNSSINNLITPVSQKIQKTDVKFQFSLKTPIWRDFFGYSNTLYLAYTQQSFWQAYNSSAFFRANNYQPEIFLENNVDVAMPCNWCFHLVNIGAMHQSNGRGGLFERTWDRVYVETIFSKDNLLLSLKPWYIVKGKALKRHNPNIGHYLGYGRILAACKWDCQVFSIVMQNFLETGFKRGSIQVNYSFPLINKLKGYIQYFNGYGQNLLEYNHRTSAVGIGISLSDWL